MEYVVVVVAVIAAVTVLVALMVSQKRLQRALIEAARSKRREAMAIRRASAERERGRAGAGAADEMNFGSEEEDEEGVTLPPTSLVLLLKEPLELEEEMLAEAVSRAWGVEVGTSEGDVCSLVPVQSPMLRGIQYKGSMFVVLCVGDPYARDRDWYVQDDAEPEVVSAWQKHRAWVSVDLAYEGPEWEHGEQEKLVAKLAAELAPAGTLAVLRPATRHAAGFDEETRLMLRRMAPWDVVKGPLRSLVILRKRFEKLTEARLLEIVGRALGGPFSTHPEGREEDFAVLTGEGEGMIQFRGFRMGVLNRDLSYVEDKEDVAGGIGDLRLRQAMTEHTCWMAVDMFEAPVGMKKSEAYQILGRVAAELIDEQTLVVYSPEVQRGVTPTARLLEDLRSSDPLHAMFNPQPAILEVKHDDPQMGAAIAEAKRRWPEFVNAFKERKPDQHFAVKCKFEDGESVEFMWVGVTSIEREEVVGILDNEPLNVHNVHCGSEVKRQADDVIDWIYTRGEEMEGNFTGPVIMAAQKGSQD